jgi:RES domain
MAVDFPSYTSSPPKTFLHITDASHIAGDLYFGLNLNNRYTAPGIGGVAYLAGDLSSCIMETLFHKSSFYQKASDRIIYKSSVEQKIVFELQLKEPLRLADVMAPGAINRALGMNLNQLFARPTVAPSVEPWPTHDLAKHIFNESDVSGKHRFDGIFYKSRQFGGECVALFERAKNKVEIVKRPRLLDHPDLADFISGNDFALLP